MPLKEKHPSGPLARLLGAALAMLACAATAETALEDPLIAQFKTSVPDPQLCGTAETRDAFLREAENNRPDRSLAADYNAKREARLNSRMNAIGMTRREQGQLAINALKHPEFEAAMASNLKAVRAMIAAARTAAEATDSEVKCGAVVELRRQLAATIDGANRQWDLMDRMVAAEAVKRGKAIP